MIILSILQCAILITLGVFHLNWVFGGTYGFEASLSTKENGERVLNPKKIDSAIVGLGLLVFGAFYLITAGIINYTLPNWILKYGGWIIPILFFLRSIGEFKYVGFFKRVKETKFGQIDTKLFSPLCLTIGIIGLVIKLW